MRLLILTCLMMVSAVTHAMANADEGLYPPPVPKDAAVVRFMNLTPGDMAVKAGSKSYGTVKSGTASPYYVQKAGNISLDLNKAASTHTLAGGQRYTAVRTADGKTVLLKDPAGDNRAKATVVVYNFSSQPITLKAKAGSVAVIENVPANNNGTRDINGVKADFSVHSADGKELTKITPVILERGITYGIIYHGNKAVMASATTDTRK